MGLIFTISLLTCAGLLLLFLGLRTAREGQLTVVEDISSARASLERNFTERYRDRMIRAGFEALSPSGALALVIIGASVAGVMVWLWRRNLVLTVMAATAVPVLFHIFVDARARRYQSRLNMALIGFLRLLYEQLSTGSKNARESFVSAANSSPLVRHALSRHLLDLQLGKPFIEVLPETTNAIQSQTWDLIVQAFIAYERRGGELLPILREAMSRMQRRAQLLMKLYNASNNIARQARFVFLGSVAMVVISGLSMPELMGALFSTTAGYVLIAVGLIISLIAQRGIIKRVRDKLERRIES